VTSPLPFQRRGFRARHDGSAIAKAPVKRRADGFRSGTEARYAVELERRKQTGEVVWWKYEAVKLRLADNTFYSPDFAVQLHSGELEMHEVKGFWQDTARVKIKVAAELFPFLFVVVTAKAKKDGGGFQLQEVE